MGALNFINIDQNAKKRFKNSSRISIRFRMNIEYNLLSYLDYRIVLEALKLKYNWNKEANKLTKRQKIKFCLMTIFFCI